MGVIICQNLIVILYKLRKCAVLVERNGYKTSLKRFASFSFLPFSSSVLVSSYPYLLS